MKINWFSPLPPSRTDIAHYTARILPALSQVADVTLWSDRGGWDPTLEAFAQVRRYDAETIQPADLNTADLNFYHIGNNVLFHGAIWRASQVVSGIVVLHDIRLHHFFTGLWDALSSGRETYLSEMEKIYGPGGREDALDLLKAYPDRIDSMAQRYSLTTPALRNALGVLVHSLEVYDQLARDISLPVAYAPLPFVSSTESAGRAMRQRPRNETDIFRLIIFGYIAPNRRLEQFLEAFSTFPRRDRFQIDIYGELWDRGRVRDRINDLGLKRQVIIHGFVPEEDLDHALAAADLAINLRYPTMGEASGSQLRCWSHGLPALVTNVGWYATLPRDVVSMVSLENETEDIHRNLGDFLDDPSKFAKIGAAGKQLLDAEHSPEKYAGAIAEIASRAPAFRLRAVSEFVAERAGAALAETSDAAASEDRQRFVAEQVFTLFSQLGSSHS